MDIKAKAEIRGFTARGRALLRAREAKGMDRAAAAKLLGLSITRLWLLECGEIDMERPNMWDEAMAILEQADAIAKETPRAK